MGCQDGKGGQLINFEAILADFERPRDGFGALKFLKAIFLLIRVSNLFF